MYRVRAIALVVVVVAVGMAGTVWALPAVQTFDTEIVALNLQGTGLMPFGSNFAPVQTQIMLHEDQARSSAGRLTFLPPDLNIPDWTVDSFFDVFFDLTFMDVDPVADFGGMADGASVHVLLPASGRIGFTVPSPGPPAIYIPSPDPPDVYAYPPAPGTMYGLLYPPNPCDLADFGLMGMLAFSMMDFTVGDLMAADAMPGGVVEYQLGLSAMISGSVNPPFGPITLTGPTTGEPGVVVTVTSTIPEPATAALGLLSLATLGLGLTRRRAPGTCGQ